MCVVATGSGTIDLTGLTIQGTGGNSALLSPILGYVYTGAPTPFGSGVTGYAGTITAQSGSSAFGTGGTTGANTGTGDQVDLAGFFGQLFVPTGYSSGAALSDSAIYDGATFASLGITPGTYVWSWDNGADTFTLTTTPLPAAFPLFATGLGGLGLLGWRRKRKAQAVA
jgi:hypothetical protein